MAEGNQELERNFISITFIAISERWVKFYPDYHEARAYKFHPYSSSFFFFFGFDYAA